MAAFAPELDIVVFAPRAASIGEMSPLSRKIFAAAAKLGLHLAVAELPVALFEGLGTRVQRDRHTLTSLRSVLMKPDHWRWVDRSWDTIRAAADELCGPEERST